MLTKLWRWLKRWWSLWFGGETPRKQEIAPSPPPKDIERVFWGLIVQAKTGATREQVQMVLMMSGVSDGELTIWLRQYAGGLTEAGISSELVEGLRLLGQLDIGAVSREALGIIGEWEEKYKLAPPVPKSPQTPSVTVADRRDESQTSPKVEAHQNINSEAEALLYQGLSLYNTGELQKSLSCFERAIKIEPNYYFAYHNRGAALEYMERYEEAILDFNTALKIQPNLHITYNGRGNVLQKMGKYEDAISDYNRAIEIQPDNCLAYNGRGNVLQEIGRYEDAISDFNKAIALQPNYPPAYNGRGNVLSNLRRYKEAIADYDKAIKIQPHFNLAYNGRGLALSHIGRYEEAIANYNKCLEIQPNYHMAYNNRGLALTVLRRYKEAIRDYDRAIEINKTDNWRVYINRGWAILNFLDYKTAIASWDKGLNCLNPDKEPLGYAILNKQKGLAHYQHGKLQAIASPFFRQAVTSYHIALNLLPDDLKFLETTLAIIQDLIPVYRALRDPENAEKWELKAIAQLGKLLKETSSPAKKLHLASKFNSFYQLQCDRLAQSDNPEDHWLALAEAEKWKNLSLQWLREGWIDPPETSENRPSLPFPNDATALLYWHLSPCTLTLFLLLPHRPDPVIFTHAIDPPGKTAPAENFSKWLKDWKQAYDKSRKKSPPDPPSTSSGHRPTLGGIGGTGIQSPPELGDLGGATSEGIGETGIQSPPELGDLGGAQKWENELPSRLQTLRQHLQIAKILPYLQDDTHLIENLILIPHRDLHLLPLHIFFANIPKSPFTCVYLPSLQIARDLMERKIKQPKQISPLSIEHPQSKTPLLFAEMASAFIAHLYDIPDNFRLTHNNATKKNIRQQLSQSANSLIFIGHGNYNPDRPLKSALYCSGDEPLTWQELFATSSNIALPSYFLVCLAACETGMTGTNKFIDECVGFPSGFLSRNTAYILSTLWIVSEDSTGIFMIEFFRTLKDRKSPAQALQHAQNWLQTATHSDLEQWYRDRAEEIKQSNLKQYQNFNSSCSTYQAKAKTNPDFCPYENPYFWAGFVLTGLP